MRRGAWAIAAFLACFSVLSLLPASPERDRIAAQPLADARLPWEMTGQGMSAPPQPSAGRTAFAPAPGGGLPAFSWPWALAAALMMAMPLWRRMALLGPRPAGPLRLRFPSAHRIHAPPA